MKFKIKEVMAAKGFNNVKLAAAMGVTRSTITNNLAKPSLETLERIAKILNVRVSDLLDEDKEEIGEKLYVLKDGVPVEVGHIEKGKIS